MSEFFLNIVNMSISASWIVLAVLLLRLLLKRAPKWITVLLWGIVAVRLICPFSIESVMSLIPSAETISPQVLIENPEINTGFPILNNTINPIIQGSTVTVAPEKSINTLQLFVLIFSKVWVVGIAGMILYTIISYFKVKRKIGTAVLFRDNIFQSESVISPFVLGIIRPKIYLPFNMNEQDMSHVIAHEQAHIRRKDHWWKPFGFLLLAIHWFNPLMWLGYVLLCRDIELACDEKVVKDLNTEQKADYSQALLTCSVNRRMIAACPLAFGEVGVKNRVKSVLNYKKPAFWIIVVAVVASIIVAVCFLTNPKQKSDLGISSQKSGTDLNGIALKIVDTDLSAPDPFIKIKWTNDTDQKVTYGEEFYIYQNMNGSWEDCRNDSNYVWDSVGYWTLPNSTSEKNYHLNGLIMTQTGKYRFETEFSVDGVSNQKYKAWIEFELEKGVPGITVHTFKTVELVYYHGGYSFLQTAEMAPTYRIANNMQLYEIYDIVYPCGKLESITLDENNFDSRFGEWELTWSDGYSLKEIKKNNRRAWQAYVTKGENTDLYLLLEQEDGTYYIGVGYANTNPVEPRNSDKSHIRWFYKLESVSGTSGTAIEQPAFDGSVYFYPSKTKETDISEYDKFYQMTDAELDELLSQLENGKWVWDNLVDRTEFYFDGQIYYDGCWIYFGFEQEIFYYVYNSAYSCGNASDAIAQMKKIYDKAEKYDPIKDVTNVGGADGPENIVVEDTRFKVVIDTATFDIDGDGKDEQCTIGYGPTSGLYTFKLSVWEIGSTDNRFDYINVFQSDPGALSFVETDEGMKLRLEPQSGAQPIDYSFSVKDGNIVLSADGESLGYWGEQGVGTVFASRNSSELYEKTSIDEIEAKYDNEEFVITKMHYKDTDGMWECEGYSYKYRLEITGRTYNAAKNSTYIVLSNTKDITFDQTWKASGLSSLTTDYFDPSIAVIVGNKLFS